MPVGNDEPMRRRFIALALVLWIALPALGSTRGERSYVLPEIRESVATAGTTVRTPVWSQAADVPRNGDMLATAPGVVVFRSHGHICAFDEATGVRRWCAGRGTQPAFASGVMAFAAEDGSVRGVDTATGQSRWRRADTTLVWAAGNGFLMAGHPERDPANNMFMRYSNVDADGRVIWSAKLNVAGQQVSIEPPYADVAFYSAGARMSKTQQILRLGPGGGLVTTLPFGWDLLDLRGGTAVVTTSPVEEVQDHFLTFDVEIDDLKSGSAKAHYHYEPDYDINNALLNTNAYAGMGSGPVRVDGGDLYVMFYAQKIYRYRLAGATGQRPLLVALRVKFLGGPYRCAVYVARPDGVWALKPEARAIRSRRVVTSTAGVSSFSIVRDVGYALFEDGRVAGFETASGRAVMDVHPCRSGEKPARVAGGPMRTYVVCSSFGSWRVVAFPQAR